MKTDRELLELAAKAAGIEHVTPTMLDYGKWNPLLDDGDALRLAVKLRMIVRCYEGSIIVDGCGVEVEEHECSDPCAATRRAIVRAAAAIGEGMK